MGAVACRTPLGCVCCTERLEGYLGRVLAGELRTNSVLFPGSP